MRGLKNIAILSFCLGLIVQPSWQPAAAQRSYGGIEGRVTTLEGWLVPYARISLTERRSRRTNVVQTGEEGEYAVCLGAGVYDVSAEVPGYKTAKRKSIEVGASGRNVVDFVMEHGKGGVSH